MKKAFILVILILFILAGCDSEKKYINIEKIVMTLESPLVSADGLLSFRSE